MELAVGAAPFPAAGRRESYATVSAPGHPATKLRGAGLITLAAPPSISITARPRSLVPSGRKRKTPSAPLKPDTLVSALSLYGSGPPFRASAAASVAAS